MASSYQPSDSKVQQKIDLAPEQRAREALEDFFSGNTASKIQTSLMFVCKTATVHNLHPAKGHSTDEGMVLLSNIRLNQLAIGVPFAGLLSVLDITFITYRNNSKAGVHCQFGVKWFSSHFPVERCAEMELVLTCSSTSYFNGSFAYVGVNAVYAVLNFVPDGLYRTVCTGRFVPDGLYRTVCTGRFVPDGLYRTTVRYKLLVTIAQKLILLNQQPREFIAPSRSCVVCVDRLHHARDNQDQQRLDQEEEKNGEAKNDAVNSGIKLTDSEIVEEAEDITAEKKTPIPIPSNVNLQKERHVKLVMQWSRGWTHPQQRQPAKGKARKLSKRGWTHPQKLQPAKGKGSPPVLHIRRSRRSLHKTCHAVV
ncbi:hypothetical protein DAPPUDRAFT_105851 [Daphnia pulex]|uniref:Uncharacterized protein n=1 Tax=Daphnia pulex TaxID=6669 RepID=E9GS02_DAPPU|nr:hypothetical protein DAPPUDRAFT_105851 [Daphnia pulex]|eukprot:EFX77617.1 hypothetical protein DAPPUDRAFT_105851 [Daphnia pulex]